MAASQANTVMSTDQLHHWALNTCERVVRGVFQDDAWCGCRGVGEPGG